jgi:preprotein translocase subunit YajC
MFLVSDAWAQTTAAAPAPTGMDGFLAKFFNSGMQGYVMIALMFVIMYFILIRPQSQERKKLENAIDKLQKGDKVVTTSGMVATIVSIDKQRAVLLIADGVKVEFLRSAIAQVVPPAEKA